MGAIADAFVTYAQPLIDETDGSESAMNRAMAVAQMCWNFALMPEDRRETAIDEMKPTLKMTDEEFAEFRQKVILPMIHRHHEMFPGLRDHFKRTSNNNSPLPLGEGLGVRADREREYRSYSLTTDKQPSSTIGPASSEKKKYSTTDRYAPCPCGSGRKYKFCCGGHQ